MLCVVAMLATAQSRPHYGYGRAATAEEINASNITVFPNGRGLPVGSGTAERGKALFKEKCAECHNEKGEGREGQYPALVGGIGSLGSGKPVKSVGSYWPYATTLWDYVNRAMPYDNPRSLSVNEVYSVAAFVLYLNGIVKVSDEMNQKTLPAVQMPNRNGFVPDPRPVARKRDR